MLKIVSEHVAAIRQNAEKILNRDWEDDGLLVAEAPSPKDVAALCADWEAMYELVVLLADKFCEQWGDCGECLPCRAKALVEEEEKDGEHGEGK